LHAKVAIILISGRRMNTLLLRVTLRLWELKWGLLL
jgi:putative copper export protein